MREPRSQKRALGTHKLFLLTQEEEWLPTASQTRSKLVLTELPHLASLPAAVPKASRVIKALRGRSHQVSFLLPLTGGNNCKEHLLQARSPQPTTESETQNSMKKTSHGCTGCLRSVGPDVVDQLLWLHFACGSIKETNKRITDSSRTPRRWAGKSS